MRHPEISNEAIIAAGKKLQEAGRRITGFGLRKMTGGGSPDRLLRVWEEHCEAERNQGRPSSRTQGLPKDIEHSLKDLASPLMDCVRQLALELYEKSETHIQQQTASDMEMSRKEQEKARAELLDAQSMLQELEEDLGYARAERIKLSSELKSARKDIEILQRQVSELERSLAVAQEKYHHEGALKDAALEALKEEKRENEELAKTISLLRAQMDELSQHHAKQIDQLLEKMKPIGPMTEK
ncbi:DNA-binding protein [Marinobacter nauticus]|uniref:KfrA N-terminal DNA-binding domain-containing protein n=1 Tax=Marinobacter nauticus (strain ATCC 700491 / DSM 11845 / VT8) TaxID=351348 RepID=A1U8L5_MARN8|nr:DNA-binding protein [Marinobacter nauticus]ABM21334.1 hypothetical protein Maqu_4061 [Marinobacter nauticus VT8]